MVICWGVKTGITLIFLIVFYLVVTEFVSLSSESVANFIFFKVFSVDFSVGFWLAIDRSRTDGSFCKL